MKNRLLLISALFFPVLLSAAESENGESHDSVREKMRQSILQANKPWTDAVTNADLVIFIGSESCRIEKSTIKGVTEKQYDKNSLKNIMHSNLENGKTVLFLFSKEFDKDDESRASRDLLSKELGEMTKNAKEARFFQAGGSQNSLIQ